MTGQPEFAPVKPADLRPTQAEERFLAAVANGQVMDYIGKDHPEITPLDAADWPDDRILRADLLSTLCLGLREDWKVHTRGIRVRGAKIVGSLNLSFALLPFPLIFHDCLFEQPLMIEYAQIRGLRLANCRLPVLVANGLVTDFSVLLFSIQADQIRMPEARVGGSFLCADSTFEDSSGSALVEGTGITTRGDFILTSCTVKGLVNLRAADIGGSLICSQTKLENPYGPAVLNADTAKVRLNIVLDDGFSAKGHIRLIGAQIGEQLNCSDATFENPNRVAIDAERIVAKGYVFVENCKVEGTLQFVGAEVGGGIICRGSVLEDAAPSPDSTQGPFAFYARRLATKGDVLLDQSVVEGTVDLVGASIDGSLSCNGATFKNPYGTAFDGEGLRVGGALLLGPLKKPPEGAINLANATVGSLADDRGSWPTDQGNLVLTGFSYNTIDERAPMDLPSRMRWLDLQSVSSLQPYERLARVYRESGRSTEAREITIAGQRARRSKGSPSWPSKAWNWFLDVTIGYGYKPWKALRIIGVFLLVGSVLFTYAQRTDAMLATKVRSGVTVSARSCTQAYPCFQPIVYSLELMLPIVNLHQREHWLPDASKRFGWFYFGYAWLVIIVGWLITTAIVAGLTGIIRRE